MRSTNKYYDLWIDADLPDQWHVSSPVNARGEWITPWTFRQGVQVSLEGEPFLPLSRSGVVLDYTETETGIAVLSQRLVSLWEHLGIQEEYQLIPARVEGQAGSYFILNTLRIIRCVDDARCGEITFWEPRHGEPERVGHYRNVRGLKIDSARVGEAHVFRPWGWTIVLVVSERVKQAMQAEGITGAKFVEV